MRPHEWPLSADRFMYRPPGRSFRRGGSGGIAAVFAERVAGIVRAEGVPVRGSYGDLCLGEL